MLHLSIGREDKWMITLVKYKTGERRVGILTGILYVLYLNHIGTCTLNKNCVMNYMNDTHCNEINSLYYMALLIFSMSDGLAFFIKFYYIIPIFVSKNKYL
jgi:hypothetical protein